MRVLLIILIAIGLTAGRAPHSRAAEPSKSDFDYEEWEKNTKHFDPTPCKPPLVVRADNDIDVNFEETNVVGNAELPEAVARNISRLAKNEVALFDWQLLSNRSCEDFMPKSFGISVTTNLDLYAVMFRGPYGHDSFRLFLHDKVGKLVSSKALEVLFRNRDAPGMDLRAPYISFTDLRKDGSQQIVIEEPYFLTTFQQATTYKYYDIGSNLQFRQVFAREARMSNTGDGWETIFTREITPLGKGKVKLTTTVKRSDSAATAKEVGYAILQSRGRGDPFWIVERHPKQRNGTFYFDTENYLIGIFATSFDHDREDENDFMAGR